MRPFTNMFLALCLAGSVCSAQENNAGVVIPSSYFGMHIQSTSTPWPTAKFGTQRFWDSGVSWTAINTSRGVYNWGGLDNRINIGSQKGLQLIYTFGRTPQWASSNPTNATCGYGPGQCAPPADLNDWDSFVRAIATRYKGRIHAYEIWNEPNHAEFYQGSIATLVEMARRAYNIIKSVDPDAIVITPCPTHTSTTPEQWMDQYFAAGGNNYYDVVGFHGYSSIMYRINGLKNVLVKYGQAGRPIWDTEASWGANASTPDANVQAGVVAKLFLQQWPAGVRKFVWYGWEYSAWGTLWDSTNGVHKAGIAYAEVYKWMVGASMPGPCTKTLTYVTVCTLNRANGYQAQAVWSDQPLQYTVPTKFASYRTVLGSTFPVSNGTVALTASPILLETPPNAAPVAVLSITPNSGIAPVTVTANTAGSSDSDGSIASVTIDFGDGTVVTAAGATHTYSTVGTYTVTATVKDNLGATASAKSTVTVTTNRPPAVTLSVQPATGQAPLPVSASTSGTTDSDGTVVDTKIDFGDGTVVSGGIATHTYQTAGTFTVTATATDERGASASVSATVNVNAPNQVPVPLLNISLGSSLDIAASLASSFDRDGNIVSGSIDFGDGTTVAGLSATHMYVTVGTYTVTGRITDNSGASAFASQTVTVGSLSRPKRLKRALGKSSGSDASRGRGTQ
jgi:PKD repeat protein